MLREAQIQLSIVFEHPEISTSFGIVKLCLIFDSLCFSPSHPFPPIDFNLALYLLLILVSSLLFNHSYDHPSFLYPFYDHLFLQKYLGRDISSQDQ